MGTLNAGSDVERDRGQLLLAGAFVLAVALIGLTIVFSASNVTTTLATEEGAVNQANHATTVRESVEADLERYFERLNERNIEAHSKNLTGQTVENFTRLTRNISTNLRHLYADRGRFVNVSVVSVQMGLQVRNDTMAAFTNGTGKVNWNVFEEGSMRNATFRFERGTLPDSTSPLIVQLNSGPAGNDWEIQVENRSRAPIGPDDFWRVSVSGPDYSGYCDRPLGTPRTMNITGATVGGEYCHALDEIVMEPGPTIEPEYTLEVRNGRVANGTFSLMTNGPLSLDFTPPPSDRIEVIYSATVRFQYHSALVDYNTTMRIAPGELR